MADKRTSLTGHVAIWGLSNRTCLLLLTCCILSKVTTNYGITTKKTITFIAQDFSSPLLSLLPSRTKSSMQINAKKSQTVCVSVKQIEFTNHCDNANSHDKAETHVQTVVKSLRFFCCISVSKYQESHRGTNETNT